VEESVAAVEEYPSAFETVTTDPARAAILLAYLAFNVYVVGFSPGEFSASPDSADNQLIAAAIADPTSLNAFFFVAFNALGVLPAVNLALLLPGSKDQKPLPTAPFVGASFALGFGAVGPYLALRQPRPQPVAPSELGFFTRYVTESRLYAAGLLAASLYLIGCLLGLGVSDMSNPAAAAAEYAELFATSKLVHVSSIDFVILSSFAFEPIREDMSRRGWWDPQSSNNDVKRLFAFSALPLLGPTAYLLLRPPLQEKQ